MDGVIARRRQKQNKTESRTNVQHSNAYQEDVPLHHNENFQYHVYQLGKAYKSDDLYVSHSDFKSYSSDDNTRGTIYKNEDSDGYRVNYDSDVKFSDAEDINYEEDLCEEESGIHFSFRDLPILAHNSILLSKRISVSFAFVAGITTMILGMFLFVGTSFAVADRVDGAGKRAIISVKLAMDSLSDKNFSASSDNIDQAYQEFLFASEEINKIGSLPTFISQFIPGASKLSSGNHIVEAGKYLTHSAQELHTIIPSVINADDALVGDDAIHISFLALYQLFAEHMSTVHADIALARTHIDKVHLDDVPMEYQDTFMRMQTILPTVEDSLQSAMEARKSVEELLGANGSRTYLFLFQNNHEMRATGGFIGSYGVLKINNGNIEKLIVDDIFNPDGQLIDHIVPPLPIQKISADWSLHDSNWFIDFPLSAQKAMDFYERTGGPTVDGVIAITPTMMKKLLVITGPIALPQYDMILTSKNFMTVMQEEVEDEESYQKTSEVATDDEKKMNSDVIDEKQKKPKKILSDLMPIMIDKLSNRKSPEHLAQMVSAISSGLKERHIMMYMSNEEVQNIVQSNGWSGSVLQTDKDYLSVVDTNINGFKTDGVIDEYITHTANIDAQGYIINTVSIRRVHNGGKTGFPWWDAVNSNYLRVYVPKGSQLISVEGHTREINKERLDYDALGYERDADVEKEENSMYIDEETGTRIYDEYNKTVFANWAYVSPQESVTVTYKYRLPFRADFDTDEDGQFGSYAILFQKQSGSERSHIESNIILDKNLLQIWHSHGDDETMMKNDLTIDRYHGIVFRVE